MKKSILIITLFFALFTVDSVKAQTEFKNFVTHKVRPKETVYSITHTYNVSKEDLISLNPHLPKLKDNFLAIDSVIKIKLLRKEKPKKILQTAPENTPVKTVKSITKQEENSTGVKDSPIKEPLIINWVSSFKNALKRGKDEKKPILVYFTGSDWCRPCEKIDAELFHTEEFKKFSDENIILYKADFPKNKDLVSAKNTVVNKKLSIRYQRKSYPTMVMINDKGDVLGRKDGYYMLDFYSDFFKEMVNKYK